MKKLLVILLVIFVVSVIFTGCNGKDDKAGAAVSEASSATGTNEAASSESTLGDASPVDSQASNGDTEGSDSSSVASEYSFDYNGTIINMNTEVSPVLAALGEPQNYFEAESCAFKGLDKIYYYSGIELSTYPNGDKDFISSVNLVDDSVSTTEGIYIGSTLDELLAAYGDGYTQDAGAYIYTKGASQITFVVENNEVTAITYLAVVEGLKQVGN